MYEIQTVLQILTLVFTVLSTTMLAMRWKCSMCGCKCSAKPKDSPPSEPSSPGSNLSEPKTPPHPAEAETDDKLDRAEKGEAH